MLIVWQKDKVMEFVMELVGVFKKLLFMLVLLLIVGDGVIVLFFLFQMFFVYCCFIEFYQSFCIFNFFGVWVGVWVGVLEYGGELGVVSCSKCFFGFLFFFGYFIIIGFGDIIKLMLEEFCNCMCVEFEFFRYGQ